MLSAFCLHDTLFGPKGWFYLRNCRSLIHAEKRRFSPHRPGSTTRADPGCGASTHADDDRLRMCVLLPAVDRCPHSGCDFPLDRWRGRGACRDDLAGASNSAFRCAFSAGGRSSGGRDADLLAVGVHHLFFGRACEPGSFTEPLSRMAALYFSLSVFSTVGFGDIAAQTDLARGLVSLQIVCNLVLIGFGVRFVVAAVSWAKAHRSPSSGPEIT